MYLIKLPSIDHPWLVLFGHSSSILVNNAMERAATHIASETAKWDAIFDKLVQEEDLFDVKLPRVTEAFQKRSVIVPY